MSSTLFVNTVTLSDASWFNDENDYLYISAPKWCGTAGGTANAITITPVSANLAISSYVAGQSFFYKSGAAANTGPMTCAVSGLAAQPMQSNGAALVANQHAANQWFRATYDGAAFQVERLSIPAAETLAGTTLASNITGSLLTSLGVFNTLFDISGVSGGQIKFPAVQNPSADVNTLDDYKEGTWTSVFTGLTVVGTPAYTGRYTKIGRTYFLSLRINSTVSTASSGPGVTSFTGLPAAPASGGAASFVDGNGTSLGNGLSPAGSGTVFCPSWSAVADVYMTFTYTV